MNRKISVGMTVTIVILAMTVTFSITMLLAMRPPLVPPPLTLRRRT